MNAVQGADRGIPGTASAGTEAQYLPSQPRTPRLTRLVEEVRAALRARPGASAEVASREVAAALAPHLGRAGLLTPDQQEADPGGYRQHVLHVEADGSFSVVALVWLPGQRTPVHDHVCWCVVGIHEGAEEETVYRLSGDPEERHLLAVDTTTSGVGAVATLAPPGDIHDVRSTAAGRAVSLHVYGADIGRLGTSIRRVYELPVRQAEDPSRHQSNSVGK
ncbi:cysteine dioxygenase family protein [Streptomyces sp. NPDC051173]|uniref:cysteine dioxygenase family protein n=1 Tax=Streptomyces sp. NPDC051173 TaxID=3155164 RepID=UPI00344BDC11